MEPKSKQISKAKAGYLAFQLRRARIWLNEIGIKTAKEAKVDDATGALLLPVIIPLENEAVKIDFPINKLGRRYIKELSDHWLKGITAGTINEMDVRKLFLALASSKIINRYANELRRVTGLVRDKKLRNFLIYRRGWAKKLIKSQS